MKKEILNCREFYWQVDIRTLAIKMGLLKNKGPWEAALDF